MGNGLVDKLPKPEYWSSNRSRGSMGSQEFPMDSLG
jgi:hypothetical protein